jgi:sugar phosphate isomerase/epimerase
MVTGVSTACLYPCETEKSLLLLLEAGFKTFEVFLNSESELSAQYLGMLHEKLLEYGARVYSFHLFTSGFEPFMFFSDYPPRFSGAAVKLGAEVAVFHGDRRESSLPLEEYCERFAKLAGAVAAEGVTLAQENVLRCKSALSANIRRMNEISGGKMKFVLDVKQAVRAQESPLEMIDAMGNSIVNVHISDNSPQRDCMLPGEGEMDFAQFKASLCKSGYDGPLIIEVYRSDWVNLQEFKTSLEFTDSIIK